MVGRALVGEVERYLESHLLGARHQLLEILQRSQLRIDCLVTALFGSNCPRAANVIGQGLLVVVLPLPIHPPDGMNRRKVENVEAHACNITQPLDAVL